MKILELFSGSGSVSKAFREAGHETFTIDIEPDFEPDLVADVLKLKVSDLPKEWRNPDVVWASPPCTTFSVASIGKYWKAGKPKRSDTYIGMALALKTLELIAELKPKYYFIENPRGMLRKQSFMLPLHRKTVTYCQYGLEYQKATDIWTNALEWIPRPVCSPKAPCHVRAPRGSRKGIQGIEPARRPAYHPDWSYVIDRKGGSAFKRAIIPEQLCQELVTFCEGKAPMVQKVLL